MEIVTKTIDINLPVTAVYNQWTQFEEFPNFMEGIEEIIQNDIRHLHWKANIGGKTEEWDAVIYEQIPDKVIAWRSISGAVNNGIVKFTALSNVKTKVKVEIAYEPKTALEKTGDALGAVSRRIAGDLKRFKDFIEERGHESGAWKGEIHEGILQAQI
jgi:uncharacterized membrane protein